MRVISETPQADYKVTIYAWNNKYLIKYERGMYEQTYKISEFDVTCDADITAIANDPEFVNQVMSKFNDMNNHLHEAINKI